MRGALCARKECILDLAGLSNSKVEVNIMARKERVVFDRLNGASEVQQIHGMPNINLDFPTILKLKDWRGLITNFTDRPVSKRTAIFSAQSARVSDSDSISPPLSRKEKRKLYNCGDKFVTLEDMPTWEAKPIPTGI